MLRGGKSMFNSKRILSLFIVICLCMGLFGVMTVQAAGKPPKSTDFTTGVLDPAIWKIENENKDTYSIEPGLGLRLPTQVNDIYEAGTGWENIFLQEAAGNWEVVSKVYYPVLPNANYQQQALLVWQDEDNYIKVDLEYTTWNGPIKAQMMYEMDGTAQGLGSQLVDAVEGEPLTVFYKIVREEDTYTGYYSMDGIDYIQLDTVTFAMENVHIGVMATKNTPLDESDMIDTYCQYIEVVTEEPLPFTIVTDNKLDKTEGGIKAAVTVVPTEDVDTHEGNEVVLFQLMKGNTPISIVAMERDITAEEDFIAYFNVDPEDDSYTVSVFVLDSFSSSTYAPISLAQKAVLN